MDATGGSTSDRGTPHTPTSNPHHPTPPPRAHNPPHQERAQPWRDPSASTISAHPLPSHRSTIFLGPHSPPIPTPELAQPRWQWRHRGRRSRHPQHQHHQHAQHGCDPEGQLGPSGDADGNGAGRLCPLAEVSALRPIDPIWPNRDRFVLGRPASMLLYSLLHLAGVRAVDPDYERLGEPSMSLEDIRASASSDSKAAGHPEYHLTLRASRRRPAPWARGSPPASAWRSLAVAGRPLQPPGLPHVRLRRLRPLRRRGPDGGRLQRGGVAPATFGSTTSAGSTTTTTSRSMGGPTSPTPMTSPHGSQGYGWNVLRVHDANDLELLTRAFEVFHGEDERPTLIVVDSHIGYGSPHKQDTAEVHGEPLGEEEVRERSGPTAGPRTPSSWFPMASTRTSPKGSGLAGGAPPEWEDLFVCYSEHGRCTTGRADAAPGAAGGWDRDLPSFDADEGPRRARPPTRC